MYSQIKAGDDHFMEMSNEEHFPIVCMVPPIVHEQTTYFVRSSDSLWKISACYQVGLLEMIAVNPQFKACNSKRCNDSCIRFIEMNKASQSRRHYEKIDLF